MNERELKLKLFLNYDTFMSNNQYNIVLACWKILTIS